MDVPVHGLAVTTARRVVSWRHGLALWLLVMLATWFLSERGDVSLTPLLLCTFFVGLDAAFAYRGDFTARPVEATMEQGNLTLRFEKPLRGNVATVRLLHDLVEAPIATVGQSSPKSDTLTLRSGNGRPVLALEFVVVTTGLGLVRAARPHVVLASPPIHDESSRPTEQARPLPADEILRSYQFGDSMRRVHWPSTARTGNLLVRAADHRESSPVVVVVERQESLDPTSWSDTVEGVAAVVHAALSEQREVRLVSRSVDTAVGGPLHESIRTAGLSAVLQDVEALAQFGEVVDQPVGSVEQAQAILAAVVPGSVGEVDENEVRIP